MGTANDGAAPPIALLAGGAAGIMATIAASGGVIRNGARMASSRLKLASMAAAMALVALPAVAQQTGKIRSTHGAWSIVCDTPAGATAEQCAMMQNVVAEDRPEIGLSVVVL